MEIALNSPNCVEKVCFCAIPAPDYNIRGRVQRESSSLVLDSLFNPPVKPEEENDIFGEKEVVPGRRQKTEMAFLDVIPEEAVIQRKGLDSVSGTE